MYIATFDSEAGKGLIWGIKEEHHLQKALKAYLYFLHVFFALDFKQYSGIAFFRADMR